MKSPVREVKYFKRGAIAYISNLPVILEDQQDILKLMRERTCMLFLIPLAWAQNWTFWGLELAQKHLQVSLKYHKYFPFAFVFLHLTSSPKSSFHEGLWKADLVNDDISGLFRSHQGFV